jgi:hypothetical protein
VVTAVTLTSGASALRAAEVVVAPRLDVRAGDDDGGGVLVS